MAEGDIIQDSENYRGKETYSFKEICLAQVKRCVVALSQEMREGFWIYSSTPNQAPEKIKYVGDAREEAVNSIKTLHDLLLPKFDKEAKEEIKKILESSSERHKTLKEEHDKSQDKKNVAERWKDNKVDFYREMFQQLCLFLERLGWLESGVMEEED